MPSSLRRCSSSAVASRAFLLGHDALPLGHAALAVLRVRLPAIELVEPAGELLLLLQDAPLDPLNLLLAGAALLIELGANPQRMLLGLELARADPGLGFADLGLALADLGLGVTRGLIDQALGVLEDPLGARLGVAERARGGELLGEISDEQAEEGSKRQEPGYCVHR